MEEREKILEAIELNDKEKLIRDLSIKGREREREKRERNLLIS
jgi:hypothetical protein